MSDIRTPPSSVEAERAVLGSVLLDTVGRGDDRVMDLCLTGGITPDSFFDPRNRIVYSTMLSMNRNSRPLDAVTLMEEMRQSGDLETVGGVAYIESLVEQVPTTAHAEHYIGIVRAKHLRRTMIERASKIVEKCFDEGKYPDPQAVLGDAEKSFLEIGVDGGGTMPWDRAVIESYEKIDRMFESNGRSMEGLSTGLTHLDEKLQGLKPSEMIVIAARPSVGKTSLAMNIAESCALGRDMNNVPVKYDGGQKHAVLVFSLEMPVEALSKRMIAGRAQVDTWRLNRGLCAREEKKEMTARLQVAVGELKSAKLYVDDTAGLDVMDLRARARRMKKAHGIELIVIDYLQLCCCREYAKQGRQIEVSQISQQIKAMAKELKIPVIVLSQLSRANEQRNDKYERPKLSDLRDSGAIEQDADVVILLRRPSRSSSDPEKDDLTLAYADIAKNRNGDTNDVRMTFLRERTRFFDRDPVRDGNEGETPEEEPVSNREEYEEASLV